VGLEEIHCRRVSWSDAQSFPVPIPKEVFDLLQNAQRQNPSQTAPIQRQDAFRSAVVAKVLIPIHDAVRHDFLIAALI
jgi:hypothetical protein